MKKWGLAGLFLLMGAPVAAASNGEQACQLDEQRRRTEQAAPAAPHTADPERPTITAPRAVTVEQGSPQPRRRGGRRIPDAELIGPRGAL